MHTIISLFTSIYDKNNKEKQQHPSPLCMTTLLNVSLNWSGWPSGHLRVVGKLSDVSLKQEKCWVSSSKDLSWAHWKNKPVVLKWWRWVTWYTSCLHKENFMHHLKYMVWLFFPPQWFGICLHVFTVHINDPLRAQCAQGSSYQLRRHRATWLRSSSF